MRRCKHAHGRACTAGRSAERTRYVSMSIQTVIRTYIACACHVFVALHLWYVHMPTSHMYCYLGHQQNVQQCLSWCHCARVPSTSESEHLPPSPHAASWLQRLRLVPLTSTILNISSSDKRREGAGLFLAWERLSCAVGLGVGPVVAHQPPHVRVGALELGAVQRKRE